MTQQPGTWKGDEGCLGISIAGVAIFIFTLLLVFG